MKKLTIDYYIERKQGEFSKIKNEIKEKNDLVYNFKKTHNLIKNVLHYFLNMEFKNDFFTCRLWIIKVEREGFEDDVEGKDLRSDRK